MSLRIRIGNQTSYGALNAMEPFEFALENGFDAFEWFADKKISSDGSACGWAESDMTEERRIEIRRLGAERDVLFSVHAPWQANPLEWGGDRILMSSIDFACDIGAHLVNLHLNMDRGPQGFAEAMVPVIRYAAEERIRLSIENTPHTTAGDLNATFECLKKLADTDTAHVGMCLDIGHANLSHGTQNDFVRYIDQLAPEIPITHLHVHENYGDSDSHLTLFTGPARNNDSGLRAFIERMDKRSYHGAMILEQWPNPPRLLVEAAERLRGLLGPRVDEGHLSRGHWRG